MGLFRRWLDWYVFGVMQSILMQYQISIWQRSVPLLHCKCWCDITHISFKSLEKITVTWALGAEFCGYEP
jgi:hypothetical protein